MSSEIKGLEVEVFKRSTYPGQKDEMVCRGVVHDVWPSPGTSNTQPGIILLLSLGNGPNKKFFPQHMLVKKNYFKISERT